MGLYEQQTTNVQRVTSGAGAPGQALKVFSGTQLLTSGPTIVLETVTTGKTLRITDIIFTTDASAPVVIQIQAAGVTIFPCAISTTSNVQAVGLDTQPTATTGQQVQILCGTVSAKTLYYYVAGFEE